MSQTLFQVGVGSGGMAVLDALCRDQRLNRFVLVDPDRYESHNADRHYFGPDATGCRKVDLAAQWVRQFRPDAEVIPIAGDLLEQTEQYHPWVHDCVVGVCAVDNEAAKFAFDELMRSEQKPWTLGEVLSGGIGGWVHRLVPDGPCYGCVARNLRREIQTEVPESVDYSNPQGSSATRIPASKASIAIIAGMHASITLDLLQGVNHDFTSLLWSLSAVEGIFPDAFRAYRFAMNRSPECLICQRHTITEEDLDVELDRALSRLGATLGPA